MSTPLSDLASPESMICTIIDFIMKSNLSSLQNSKNSKRSLAHVQGAKNVVQMLSILDEHLRTFVDKVA